MGRNHTAVPARKDTRARIRELYLKTGIHMCDLVDVAATILEVIYEKGVPKDLLWEVAVRNPDHAKILERLGRYASK